MFRRFVSFAVIYAAASMASASDSQRTILDVRGMDCATCPITVKAVLRKEPGVKDVKVDFTKRTAEITFEPGKVSPERLAQLVTEAGFPSSPRK